MQLNTEQIKQLQAQETEDLKPKPYIDKNWDSGPNGVPC